MKDATSCGTKARIGTRIGAKLRRKKKSALTKRVLKQATLDPRMS